VYRDGKTAICEVEGALIKAQTIRDWQVEDKTWKRRVCVTVYTHNTIKDMQVRLEAPVSEFAKRGGCQAGPGEETHAVPGSGLPLLGQVTGSERGRRRGSNRQSETTAELHRHTGR
jgi:hypothetical protein